MAQRADQKRQADHPVQDDHQHREHGIAGQRRLVGSVLGLSTTRQPIREAQ
jgi:hypothetical protein